MDYNKKTGFWTIIIGLLVVIFAVYLYFDKKIEDSSLTARSRGKILKYISVKEGKKISHFPMIEFTTVGSTPTSHTFIDYEQSLSLRQKKEMDILYNPNDPNQATVYDHYDQWGVSVSVAIIGLFIILFGLALYYIKTKNQFFN